MDKSVLRRIKELEKAHPDPLILEATLPNGSSKAMRVSEYFAQETLLDFRVISGDNGLLALFDASDLWQGIFKRVTSGEKCPAMKNDAGLAGDQAVSLATALCVRAPTRKLEDFY